MKSKFIEILQFKVYSHALTVVYVVGRLKTAVFRFAICMFFNITTIDTLLLQS